MAFRKGKSAIMADEQTTAADVSVPQRDRNTRAETETLDQRELEAEKAQAAKQKAADKQARKEDKASRGLARRRAKWDSDRESLWYAEQLDDVKDDGRPFDIAPGAHKAYNDMLRAYNEFKLAVGVYNEAGGIPFDPDADEEDDE